MASSPTQIVVAGALISDAALLVAQRARPPELAGLWELPGGKVAPGESDAAALVRELREELGITVTVGPRLGADVALPSTAAQIMTLRAYLVTCTDGAPRPDDHRALRWVAADELDELPWVPADRAWLPDLEQALRVTARAVTPNQASAATPNRADDTAPTQAGAAAPNRSDATPLSRPAAAPPNQ